jgi:hypothetical protein
MIAFGSVEPTQDMLPIPGTYVQLTLDEHFDSAFDSTPVGLIVESRSHAPLAA